MRINYKLTLLWAAALLPAGMCLTANAQEAAEEKGSLMVYADPDHFEHVYGGVSESEYIDLAFSLEGEANEVPATGAYQIMFVPKEGLAVAYDVFYIQNDGAKKQQNYTKQTAAYTIKPTKIENYNNGGGVMADSFLLLPEGQEWSYNVILDPEHFTITDYANGNAPMTGSLEGELNRFTTTSSKPQIKPSSDNIAYTSYFFPAGIEDFSDKSQALYTKTAVAKYTMQKYNVFDLNLYNSIADGGTLLIESVPGLGTGNITINIDGDASLLDVSYNGVSHENKGFAPLQAGENVVAITSPNISFSHKTSGVRLASVKCNGVDLDGTVAGGDDMGMSTYAAGNAYIFSYTKAKNGDVFDVVIALEGKSNVDIVVTEGCESFVTKVSADGEELEWTPGETLVVGRGKTLVIEGDKYTYVVDGTAVEGNDPKYKSAYEQYVVNDMTITFDVTPVYRDKDFTLQVGNNANVQILNANGTSKLFDTANTTHKLAFGDSDNLVTFVGFNRSKNEKDLMHWYLDGQLVAFCSDDFIHKLREGDVVRFTCDKNSDLDPEVLTNVSVLLEGDLEIMPHVTVGNEFMTLPYFIVDRDSEILLKSNDDMDIISVKAGNNAVMPDADGTYSIPCNDSKLRLYVTGKKKSELPSGITEVSSENAPTVICNLQGIRVNNDKPSAGIYIVNGRKVVVK